MKWQNLKLVVSFAALTALTTPAQATIVDKLPQVSLKQACQSLLAEQSNPALDRECKHYISGYFRGLATQQQDAEQQGLITFERQEDGKTFEQRALQTRAGGQLKRLERIAERQSCQTDSHQQSIHLGYIADDLGYTGEQRTLLISALRDYLLVKDIC
ncbi:hypothetical protein HBA55_04275 [Pseudomaricurvus alkylphenolicus]|jgi:hypothetical protein|uniref:hypothetical protein n=1 Tax=Pseudomaricurvus alkylphenolicus TaxID=1306991 RepID=UPI00141E3936|nr:hypothetical protein [Pseudomaricurvus alkylphenolicus]NIB38787.1 hypothetical protein [Pseudomaricurvus alkylphenolicus]